MNDELWQYLPIAGVLLLGAFVAATLPSKKRDAPDEEHEDDDEDDE
jgi:hypothetical protein